MKKQIHYNIFRGVLCLVALNFAIIPNSLGQDFEENLPIESDEQGSPLVRARALFLSGSYSAASEVYQQAFGLDREDGLVGASRSLAMVGNLKAAAAVIESDHSQYEDFPLAATQLAEVRREQG